MASAIGPSKFAEIMVLDLFQITLGYRDSQLLIGFQHNTPDNTLPIIWYDEQAGRPGNPSFAVTEGVAQMHNDNTSDKNPFNITKATDFSDREILNYWVDLLKRVVFTELVKPTSPMPMFILGGKGSGKTHLNRYLSYFSQRIRNAPTVLQGVSPNSYLGIYMRCSGLNAARFKNKDQPGGCLGWRSWLSLRALACTDRSR